MNSSNFNSEEFLGFYSNDNRVSEKDVDSSAMDFLQLAFVLSEDIPDLSEDEINTAVEKILERTHPSERHTHSDKTDKNVKLTIKALLTAAVFAVVSITCLFAVGTSHNISIENGFVPFAKATMKIAFFGEENITADQLLADLEVHGFEDVLLPEKLTFNQGIYKVGMPEYYLDGSRQEASFEISDSKNRYMFTVSKAGFSKSAASYRNVESARTVVSDGVDIYVFEFDGYCLIELCHDDLCYRITSEASVSDMVEIAESMK